MCIRDSTSHILLSSSDFDYKNPQFDKSMETIGYFVRDCLFAYEKWSSPDVSKAVSYTHLRAHETVLDLVCRLLLEKKKNNKTQCDYL